MVSYLFRVSGMPKNVSRQMIIHALDGSLLCAVLSGDSLADTLTEIGLDKTYWDYIHSILCLILKLRRRQRVRADPVYVHLRDHSTKQYRELLKSSVLTDELVLEKRIGEGGFGRVYMGKFTPKRSRNYSDKQIDATNNDDNGDELWNNTKDLFGNRSKENANEDSGLGVSVAVKVFRPAASNGGPQHKNLETAAFVHRGLQAIQAAAARDFYTEFQILSRLRHPNVTLFIGAVLNPLYCLITEYVRCGALFDILHRRGYKFELYQILQIAHDICCGMAYLHANGIIHCDLKSANILLESSGNAKICDFGLAVDTANERLSYGDTPDTPLLLGFVGTHHWMAPEVMRGEPYSPYSDVFSFGMILWELLTNSIPFANLSLVHIVALVGYGAHGPGPLNFEDIDARKTPIRNDNQNPSSYSKVEKPNQNHVASLASLLQSVAGNDKVTGPKQGFDANLVTENKRNIKTGSTFGRPDIFYMRRKKPRRTRSAHSYLGYLDSGVICASKTLLRIVQECARFDVADRPDFATLTEVFQILSESSVVEVEENLDQFFGN